MNINCEIRKKSYVSPYVSFEEIEQDLELLAGTGTEGGGHNQNAGSSENTSNDPDFESNGAKAATGPFDDGEYDFVFEYDE